MMPESQRRTILIVDDEPVNTQLVWKLLDDEYDVVAAMTGREALEMAAAQRPDLILLDVMLPDMNGFELCERLRVDPLTDTIPIIFITTLDSAEDRVRGFQAGGVDYITKPYCREEALARIHTHLALRNLRLELEARNRELDRCKKRLAAGQHTGP